jgi:RNA-splicing ligase RtcB
MKGIKLVAGDRSRIKEEAPGAYKDIEEVVRIVVKCGCQYRSCYTPSPVNCRL